MAGGCLYGGDGRYRRSDFIVVGRPAVMVGALAATAVVNHRRKSRGPPRSRSLLARRPARPRSGPTTHRLVCDTSFGLVDFYYEAATEFYPDLDNWTLTLGFPRLVPTAFG